MIVTVPTKDVMAFWPTVAPLLYRAVRLSKGRRSLEEVEQELQEGKQHLWLAFDDAEILAAFTTAIIAYPERRMLRVELCGGRGLKRWAADAVREVKQFAARHDCGALEMIGRAGWERSLGLKPVLKVYEMEV